MNGLIETPKGFYSYYPKYKGYSLEKALKEVGEDDTTKYHLFWIAKTNGLRKYKGRIREKLYLLKLLEQGRLIKNDIADNFYPKCDNNLSLKRALRSVGELDTTPSRLKEIAFLNNIDNYYGSNAQDYKLRQMLRLGTLRRK